MYSGIPLGDLASSDVAVNAVAQELQTFWPMERELLASILEMLHVLVLTTQAANGGKNLPKPLHIQRPDIQMSGRRPAKETGGRSAPVISMSEFVQRERRGDL